MEDQNEKKVEWDMLEVSTRTMIASTRLDLEMEKIYEGLQPEEEMKKDEIHFPGFSYRLVVVYYKNMMKQAKRWNPKYHRRFGQATRQNSSTTTPTSSKKSFRNALNVIYELSYSVPSSSSPISKHVNFKISKNGKFQLTGCKEESFAQICVLDCLRRIFQHTPDAIICPSLPTLLSKGMEISFQTVMTNLDFHVGFTVNRQALDDYINQKTHYYSLLETSFGYTGVNIKFPLESSWWVTECPMIHWNPSTETIQHYTKPLHHILSSDVLARYQRKGRYNTFLVFHSGKIIMSGMFLETMKPHFEQFYQMMQEWKPWIEERIEKT